MNEVVIDDSQREMCAVLVMRTMLTDYCNDTGVSFNDVFFRFVTSCYLTIPPDSGWKDPIISATSLKIP